MSKQYTKKYFCWFRINFIAFLLITVGEISLFAQNRISYNNRPLFLSGSNVAWVSFGRDIGPDNTNFTAFQTMFDSVRANHGNSLRFWLHTNGSSSPEFGTDGKVTGPGTNTISDLKTILDMAWERKIGLMLCLWSFDMLHKNNSTIIKSRNKLLLTDTSYLRAYIDHALIPMVSALKGHPAIQSWEIFNEAEGMSIEYGWPDITTVDIPMLQIQRFVNLVTGAIHRTDPGAQVTTGAWSFKVLTDVTPLAKQMSTQSILRSLSADEKIKMERDFEVRYKVHVSAENIINRFTAAVQDQNYYRDDRLVASGGDVDGTLDFYTVHYYTWAGTPLSPFHHPASYWQLDKPIAVAEFFLENTFGILYKNLFSNLFDNGYAGALTWAWLSNDVQQPRTKEAMNDLFSRSPDDLDVTQASGKVYAFTASAKTIDSGDSTTLMWTTSRGSSAYLDDVSVPSKGTMTVWPASAMTYSLTAAGEVSDTAKVSINFYPSGTILSFRVVPSVIVTGDSAVLYWHTSSGSVTTLNNRAVKENDSLVIRDLFTNLYVLNTTGAVNKTMQIMLTVLKPEEMNRALNKPINVIPYDSLSSPSEMVDGSFITEWNSASAGPTKILIDLQQTYRIQKILLSWGTNYASQYRMLTSPNGTDWSLLKQIFDGPGGRDEHDSVNVICRYFWLQLDRCAVINASHFDLNEIQVFGLAATTSVQADAERTRPTAIHLSDNYPNPFNPSTAFDFSVPADGTATLTIFNVLGEEVATLFHGMARWGMLYHVQFHGDRLASGIYMARLNWNNQRTTKKLLLIR